jgi:hypothetical protein
LTRTRNHDTGCSHHVQGRSGLKHTVGWGASAQASRTLCHNCLLPGPDSDLWDWYPCLGGHGTPYSRRRPFHLPRRNSFGSRFRAGDMPAPSHCCNVTNLHRHMAGQGEGSQPAIHLRCTARLLAHRCVFEGTMARGH